ncbi:uncharacterized protein LOC115210334 [Argonauta hians]
MADTKYLIMPTLKDDLLFNKNSSHVLGMEDTIVQIMFKYLNPIFLLCGTIGNIMSFTMMHKMSARVWSSCVYLSVLAVVDLLILYLDCGNRWYKQLTNVDLNVVIMTSTHAMCQVYLFFYNFIFHFSAWLVVAITGECLISIKSPIFKYKSCTREHARAIILFITVMLIGINIHYFWTHTLVDKQSSNILQRKACINVDELSDVIKDQVWHYLDIFIKDIIPLLVICLLVTMIAMILHANISNAKGMEPVLKKYYMDIESFHEMCYIVIVIAIIYIVCTLPKIGLTVIHHCVVYGLLPYTHNLGAKLKLADAICQMFQYGYHSLKLFIYIYFCKRINIWTKRSTKSFLTQTCSNSNNSNKGPRSNSFYGQQSIERPLSNQHYFQHNKSTQPPESSFFKEKQRVTFSKPRVFTQTQV